MKLPAFKMKDLSHKDGTEDSCLLEVTLYLGV
jgi:hypothetical protein